MIVIGADPHKSTHTAAAVDGATAEIKASLTAPARERGHRELLDWARELDAERVWAIEDCRGVSGGLERFLVEHGEQVVRVAPKHMAGARRSVREPGKSDPIDALAVARAALREGIDALPQAFLDGQASEIKLIADHREGLVAERTRMQSRLRWHLHALWPELEIPKRGLDRPKWLERLAGRLARAERSARVRVYRDLVCRLKGLTRKINELKRELGPLVAAKNPRLCELPGCGVLTAAKLIAETAGVERSSSEAKFARLAGVAPIPASSGRTDRHRLDRGGNRQLNRALHVIAVSQGRNHGPAIAYLAPKQAEGKTRKEAVRCLKRQLVRTVLRALRHSTSEPRFHPLSIKKEMERATFRGMAPLTYLT